ncbi:hypothetical protein GQ44DRAFT_648313 [Phaeosphaeriaceae sp. PMI808]|nr:hypothetical protein GQ44DRAFT_648313 [Phaeosphaeriaceae sp. PMI808]
MEEDELDIAAAMGFSSFGGTKKRKHDQTSSPKSKVDASGANSTALGARPKKSTDDFPEQSSIEDHAAIDRDVPTPHVAQPKKAQKPADPTGLAAFLARAQMLPETPSKMEQVNLTSRQPEPSNTETISFGGPSISKAELNALRFGIKNEHGDTAYFLPNFVEDPWKPLRGGR